MASAKAADIPNEQKMWTDVWNWRKKYYFPEDSEEYWRNFAKDGVFLGEKYGKLCQSIVLAIIEETKGRWKKC